MATPKTSIFDFADKFGYTSPFATDWVAEGAEQRAERAQAREQWQAARPLQNDIAITISSTVVGDSTQIDIHFQAAIYNYIYYNFPIKDGYVLKRLIEETLVKNWIRTDIKGYKITVTTDIIVVPAADNAALVQSYEGLGYVKDPKRTCLYPESGIGERMYAAAEPGGAYIEINAKNFLVSNRDEAKIKNALVHEFGHSLGIKYHSDERANGGLNLPKQDAVYNELKVSNPDSPDLNPSCEQTKGDKYNLMRASYDTDGIFGKNLAKGQIETILNASETPYRTHTE